MTALDHVNGPADAPLVLVEYGDYECPHCGAAHPVVKRLQDVLAPDLRFIFRNFPLPEIHPHAMHAAAAAEAAALQGKFWQMHDTLLERQDRLDDRSLALYARELGLDARTFSDNMQSPDIERRIAAEVLSGAARGVISTPTFFIQGLRYDGEHSYEALLRALTPETSVPQVF